ncbi:Hypothetical_protein [Hexamita inflata]|uniref:Hypothetical_protein n=1 Tax=Hexamita inflata TaxID=28002 RepID=A0AA86NBK7_9EUKA|nr:Hypothetical protein HINF_LOCUS4003 [Hexamita inflata]
MNSLAITLVEIVFSTSIPKIVRDLSIIINKQSSPAIFIVRQTRRMSVIINIFYVFSSILICYIPRFDQNNKKQRGQKSIQEQPTKPSNEKKKKIDPINIFEFYVFQSGKKDISIKRAVYLSELNVLIYSVITGLIIFLQTIQKRSEYDK